MLWHMSTTLLPMIQALYPSGHRFVQDNDPKHTSRLTQQFCMKKESISGVPHLSHLIAV